MPDPSANLSPPNVRIFVDFENVQQIDFAAFGSMPVCFTLLLGAQQNKMDVGLVEKLVEHANAVQLVRLTSSGKNALDFALAFYVGRAVTADPSAYFHVISKDKGFDSLIEHLNSRHIKATRHDDFSTLMFSSPQKALSSKIEGDLLTRVVENLKKNKKSRPKKHKALRSHLRAFGGKGTTAAVVLELVDYLQTNGHLTIDEKERVIYFL